MYAIMHAAAVLNRAIAPPQPNTCPVRLIAMWPCMSRLALYTLVCPPLWTAIQWPNPRNAPECMMQISHYDNSKCNSKQKQCEEIHSVYDANSRSNRCHAFIHYLFLGTWVALSTFSYIYTPFLGPVKFSYEFDFEDHWKTSKWLPILLLTINFNAMQTIKSGTIVTSNIDLHGLWDNVNKATCAIQDI